MSLRLVKDSLYCLLDAKKKYQDAKEYYEAVRKKESVKISNYIFSELPKGSKSFEIGMNEGNMFYQNNKTYVVSSYRKTSITWFIDKIKKNISKEYTRKFIDRTYTVNDMEGLVSYLKSCGVNPVEFKKYIDVSESINKEKLDRLYELGEIKRNDIKDCYVIEYGDPCVRIVEKKHG